MDDDDQKLEVLGDGSSGEESRGQEEKGRRREEEKVKRTGRKSSRLHYNAPRYSSVPYLTKRARHDTQDRRWWVGSRMTVSVVPEA
jgi:hypothetical protein